MQLNNRGEPVYGEESGLATEYKTSVLKHAASGAVEVFTDPEASPTGYPFKVVRWPGDPTRTTVARERICDLGYLRTAYQDTDGRLGYRCPAEPVAAYVEKGGRAEDTIGRRCLCNALMANAGHPQVRGEGRVEPPPPSRAGTTCRRSAVSSPGASGTLRTRCSTTSWATSLVGTSHPAFGC